jgi:two-component system, sensor histidine kinase YesM
MRFRTRMIIIYTCFVGIIAIVLGICFSVYNFKQYRTNEYSNMELLASQLSNQFDETIKPMRFITSYLLSDMEVLNALRTLAKVDATIESNKQYREEALSDIRTKIYSDYIMANYYRVIVFNQKGDTVANNNYKGYVINPNKDINDITWIGKMDGNNGVPVLIGPHKDEWGLISQPQVYSIVKAVQGKNMGYIEVQKRADTLEELFKVPKEDIYVAVVLPNGEFLYADQGGEFGDFYSKLVLNNQTGTMEIVNASHKKEIISIYHSKETDVYVIVKEDLAAMQKEAAYIMPITLLLVSVFAGISLILVFIISTFLTNPIKKLTELMERTNVERLGTKINIDNSNDEIEALYQSYQGVLNRLNEGVIKEKRLSLLQLQAQFDLLQAQVNPHFLYNVLNVISNKGVINDDESICQICACLGRMLRYATNTKIRVAKIAEEIEYLESYFYLLKSRYEHKIEYSIEIDETIKDQIIPKILFQQIVENSVNHGFENISGIMRVDITGYQENNRWYVCINDNGRGFDASDIIILKQRMAEIYKKLMEADESVEMEIGGMGIVNVYARLVLLYKGDVTFNVANNLQGARVIIGAPIQIAEGGIS